MAIARLSRKLPPQFRQYVKFGFVGILATGLHSGLFIALVELMQATPIVANTIAFLIAFTVTYFGNNHWTFKVGRIGIDSLVKSFAVSMVGFALNSAFILFVTRVIGQSYLFSLPFMIGVVPVLIFWLNKNWVFRPT